MTLEEKIQELNAMGARVTFAWSKDDDKKDRFVVDVDLEFVKFTGASSIRMSDALDGAIQRTHSYLLAERNRLTRRIEVLTGLRES